MNAARNARPHTAGFNAMLRAGNAAVAHSLRFGARRLDAAAAARNNATMPKALPASDPRLAPKATPPDAGFDPALLRGDAWRVARRLLGALLVGTGDANSDPVVGRIVETEAYCAGDAASHSARGRTPRNGAMFGRGGVAYVYRSYGLHWCINVSCGEEGEGAAVLLRALEPLAGLDVMRSRRLPTAGKDLQLCRGPGNLARALGIDLRHDGLDLLDPAAPLRLCTGPSVPATQVRRSPRVGITRATDKLWRFYVHPSPFVSGPRGGQPLRATATT